MQTIDPPPAAIGSGRLQLVGLAPATTCHHCGKPTICTLVLRTESGEEFLIGSTCAANNLLDLWKTHTAAKWKEFAIHVRSCVWRGSEIHCLYMIGKYQSYGDLFRLNAEEIARAKFWEDRLEELQAPKTREFSLPELEIGKACAA